MLYEGQPGVVSLRDPKLLCRRLAPGLALVSYTRSIKKYIYLRGLGMMGIGLGLGVHDTFKKKISTTGVMIIYCMSEFQSKIIEYFVRLNCENETTKLMIRIRQKQKHHITIAIPPPRDE